MTGGMADADVTALRLTEAAINALAHRDEEHWHALAKEAVHSTGLDREEGALVLRALALQSAAVINLLAEALGTVTAEVFAQLEESRTLWWLDFDPEAGEGP